MPNNDLAYPSEQELLYSQVKEKITAPLVVARRLAGPGNSGIPTRITLRAGRRNVADWGCDDQPIPMRVKSGRLLALPYQQGLSDMIYMSHNHTPDQYLEMVQDQFDILYQESKANGRVMTLSLHPYISGLPFRIKALDKAMEYIRSRDEVWLATGAEIADAYHKGAKKNRAPA